MDLDWEVRKVDCEYVVEDGIIKRKPAYRPVSIGLKKRNRSLENVFSEQAMCSLLDDQIGPGLEFHHDYRD